MASPAPLDHCSIEPPGGLDGEQRPPPPPLRILAPHLVGYLSSSWRNSSMSTRDTAYTLYSAAGREAPAREAVSEGLRQDEASSAAGERGTYVAYCYPGHLGHAAPRAANSRRWA